MKRMVSTPIRYDTMVSEMSASVRLRAILYSAYSGTGTATAAKVSSMAHAAMMALLRSFAFDALRLSFMPPPRHCKPGGMRRNPSRHAARSRRKGLFACCYRRCLNIATHPGTIEMAASSAMMAYTVARSNVAVSAVWMVETTVDPT